MLKQQGQKPISGPVAIDLLVEDKGRVDISNLIKAVEDLLVSHGMIDGDGREVVRHVAIDWARDVQGIRVSVQGVSK